MRTNMRWTNEELGKLLSLRKEGKSITEIADEYDVTRERIYQVCRYYKLKYKKSEIKKDFENTDQKICVA